VFEVLDHFTLCRSRRRSLIKDASFNHKEENVMKATYAIRKLVEKALHIRQLTPDIENEINYELTRLGHISDADYEALELLMSEMDEGRIQLVPNP
jgi:predicted MarR family transcription regulator